MYGGLEGMRYLENIKQDNVNKNKKIDCIMLDLMMPDIYGLNVLKKLKKDPILRNIPVIIQSASHDKAEHHKAINLGAVAFINKPYNREKLRDAFIKCTDN